MDNKKRNMGWREVMNKIYTAKDAGEISRLKEKLNVYKEVVKMLSESNSFYADDDNWYEASKTVKYNKISSRDLETRHRVVEIGGKRARIAEKKAAELLGENNE